MADDAFPPPGLTLDLETLLQPISEAAPSGESLRYEGTYDKILEARRSDESELPQGVWKTEVKLADWREAERLCLTALKEQTKDVQIALWLTEAWMQRHGFSGLRHGCELVAELSERFWDTLHPQVRDGDLDYRLAPYVWLSENLSFAVMRLPLLPSAPDHDLPALTSADWQGAVRLEKLSANEPQAYQQELTEGRITLEYFSHVASRGNREVCQTNHGHVRATLASLDRVDAFLSEVCGREAPSLRKVRNVLKDALSVFQTCILPAVGADWRPAKNAPASDEDLSAATPGMTPVADPGGYGAPGGGPMATTSAQLQGRAQAYRTLAQVADYLMQIEPHSPTPYLIRRAVSWERMSLIQLMQELLRSPEELAALHSLLGIPFRGFEE